jgi:DNA gyrase/topoisomerase IV subunit A
MEYAHLLVDGQGNFGSVDGDSQRNALYRNQENARFQIQYREKKQWIFS